MQSFCKFLRFISFKVMRKRFDNVELPLSLLVERKLVESLRALEFDGPYWTKLSALVIRSKA